MEDQDKMAFLAQAINKSKTVMRAVETKQYRTGQIDPNKLVAEQTIDYNPNMMAPPPQTNMNQVPTVNMNNLSKSRMPREIIESFKAKPPMTDQQGGLGLGFLDEISRGQQPQPQPVITERPVSQQPMQPVQPIPQYQQPIYQQPMMGGMNELQLEGLKSVIEKVVRETMDAVLKEREQLTESSTINENIQIKIGESIFGGKITNVKTVKK